MVLAIMADVAVIAEQILEQSGLSYELHANGTNLEGEWDEVMQAIKTCHERLHEMRTDREQKMTDKIVSVCEKLEKDSSC